MTHSPASHVPTPGLAPDAAPAPPRPATVPHEHRLRLMLLVVATLVCLLVWAGIAWVLAAERRDALEAQRRQNVNIARTLKEQTLRVLAATDQATVRVRDAVAGSADGSRPDLVRFAAETGLVPGILVQLAWVGVDGRLVGSNLDPDGSRTQRVDLSDREHIRAHTRPDSLPADMRPATPDALFIGKPVLGKVSGRWTTQLSRRIVASDGRLLGVVVASLDPSYFEGVYRGLDVGRHGTLALVGTDAVMRARVVGAEPRGMGAEVSRSGPFATYSGAQEGSLVAVSSVDGIERVIAFQRVGEYPLIQLVTTSTDEAEAAWRNQRDLAVGLAALLTAAVAVGVTSLWVNLGRIQRTVAALRESEARAQAASQAKSEFLAAVSHELRTPLTSIRGFAEVMETRLEDPRMRRSATLIRKGAEHLNALLTEILDLAKVEAGAMPVQVEPVDLRPLLQGTIDFFSPTAAHKGLDLGFTIAPDVPATVRCDGLRVKQILNNLLSNALKFTEAGSVTVQAERRDDALLLQVIDTGPGIPAHLHEVVFERFRQADGRVSHEHGGTGLGLALARGLAELMDGRLELASTPGAGSRFTLTLPLA